jgi:hypothetical protein
LHLSISTGVLTLMKSAGFIAKRLQTALSFAGALCVVVFTGVRARAFFTAALGARPPALPVWAATALVSLILAAIYSKLPAVRQGRRGVRRRRALSAALSVALCVRFRGAVLDIPLKGTGMTLPLAADVLSLIGAGLLLSAFLALAAGAVRRGFEKIKAAVSPLTVKDAAFLLLLLAAVNLFAYRYITGSRTIYFGDNAGYWTISRNLAETARIGLPRLFETVYHSILTDDYNGLIALPWVPLVLLFGPSRWVFVAGIVNLALYPVYLLLYLFIKSRCRRAVPAAAAVFCMFPMLFYTSVTGFIDVAGLTPALGALLLWLRIPRLKEVRPVRYYASPQSGPDDAVETPYAGLCRYFAAGCLLAVTVLLRRWYAFFAVSFFAAALLDSLIFKKPALPLITAAAAFAFVLLFFFQPFVSGLLIRNYADLYSDFSFDLPVDVRYFFYYYGLFVVLILITGSLSLLSRRVTRRPAVFLLVQPVFCFALFVSVQSHGQQHLLLYIPALALLAALWVSMLVGRFEVRRTRAAALALYALLAFCALPPLVHPLLLKTRPGTITDIKTYEMLPSFIYVPPVREDADRVLHLVWYLDKSVGAGGKTLGVLASSLKLNIDILKNAESSLSLISDASASRDYLVWLPEIDSRDSFPGRLFDCDYLLVADPVQLSLGPGSQRCVDLPARQLLSGIGIGKAYRPTGYTFLLDGGAIRVRLFEKRREVTAAERDALLRAYSGV